MTVFEFQARRVERISAAVAHFIDSTPEDRLNWQPGALDGAKGRSIFSMASEIVVVNALVAKTLSGEALHAHRPSESLPDIIFTDSAEAQAKIIGSGKALAAAIRGLNDEDLEREYPHWSGPLRGEIWLEMPYRNMAYHAGQINYIQILLGDNEFHMPPGMWR